MHVRPIPVVVRARDAPRARPTRDQARREALRLQTAAGDDPRWDARTNRDAA